MSCIICLRDDFTNYKGKDITWSYEGYSQTENGEYSKVTECYLEFDGVDDYVVSRDNATADFELPFGIEFTPDVTQDFDVIGNWDGTTEAGQWIVLERTTGGFGIVNRIGSGTNVNTNAPIYVFQAGNQYSVDFYQDGTDFVMEINGVEHIRTPMTNMPSAASLRKLYIGARSTGAEHYTGKIHNWYKGTETFPMNEGSGTTITGSEGTVLDIYGATWHCVEGLNFDETCMSGPNPCFDAEHMTPGYYKFTYTKDGVQGDVYLFVGNSEDAGNPVGQAFCYQGLDFGDPAATTIDLHDYFLGATKYNIVYQDGTLTEFDGRYLEVSSLEPGEYCFTNMAEKTLPAGWKYEDCKECSDYESTCLQVVLPPDAGENRVVDVCNNVTEIFLEDYLVNNDGIGDFVILEDNLTAGTLTNTKYEPDLTDVGSGFTIAHILPSPLAPNCAGTAIIQFNVIDCVPPPMCPDDSALGLSIIESTNSSPTDPQWVDKLTLSKTGSYADAGVIDTDDIYYSNDDGVSWTKGTVVKDDDYWVQLTSSFRTTCKSSSQTGVHEVYDVALSDGNNVDEAQLITRNGNFNNSWTNIDSSAKLSAAGGSTALIDERFFRWDITHVLNSGWKLSILQTHFDRGGSPNVCPNGTGAFGIHTNSGSQSGKRKILVERRITYNNGCEAVTIEGSFEPTLPTCVETPSGIGFNIVDPYKIGGSEYNGSVSCSGSISGSATDTMYVYEQPTGSNGYASNNFSCGGSRYLAYNYSYIMVRIITFTDCPPIIITRNYGAPTSCYTATITCTKDNANSRAKANRASTPSSTSSDYLEYKRGSGSWLPYTEDQWISVTGTTTVYFRRVANYSNGCSQTTDTCSETVTPPTYSLSIGCSGNTIVVYASNMPPGGTYFLYRDGFLVDSNISGANFSISQLGSYQVKYKYNQYQTISSNSVTCGSSCSAPTVATGQCSVSGNTITVPFTTTGITSIGDIDVTPIMGTISWNPGSGVGSIVATGTPGTTYTFVIDVSNACGSDSATRTCSLGCSVLTIDDVFCDYGANRTYFSVYVSPSTGTPPSSTGGTYIGFSGNKYNFYRTGTSGTITATHPAQCSSVSKVISCTCQDPTINLGINCSLNKVTYAFSVTNEQNAGNYTLKNNGNTVATITNTGAGTYFGSYNVAQGSSNSAQVSTTSACGGTVLSNTDTSTCGCDKPVINVTASCTTTTISYSFTVSNESNVTSNYTVKVNGSTVGTITKTGSGSYSGTRTVTAGTNNTVQVTATSNCGSVTSNTASANCGCPNSSLSISGLSCNGTNQQLSFNVNQTNVTGAVLKVNGSTKTIGSNPQSFAGVPGSNTILVTGTDSCSGASLSDTQTVNCGCDDPSIVVTASCSGTTVSYSFTVTKESQVSGNYTIWVNGSSVATKTKTGSGSYSGTYTVGAGTNNTVQIRANSTCGGTVSSNTAAANCACPASSLSISGVSCNSNDQKITLTINSSNVSGTTLKLNGNNVAITSMPMTIQGVIGNNVLLVTGTDACASTTLSDTVNVNCGCINPSIVLSASCSTTTVSYSFTVGTRSQAIGNYSLYINGNYVKSITNTGASSYSGTTSVAAGSNNAVQIRVTSACGGTVNSNTVTTTCACPASDLSITNASCNSTTQMLTFTINQVNVSGAVLKVNGVTKTITSNPQTQQGVVGNNTILVTATDTCASTTLSDTKTVNCDCTEAAISLTGTCNTAGLISYSFSVSNESRTNGTYRIYVNGSDVGGKTNTGAGTYTGTYSGVAGTTYTVQIRVPNKCGGTTLSNTITTVCGCPNASITINSPACNPANQSVSFTTSAVNATINSMYLNGNLITGSGPWTGVIGTNTITINGTDTCRGTQISDTKTITCGCSLMPSVQINSKSASGNVLTVKYSTVNIGAANQITFKGNGVTRPVLADGANKWKSTFTLNEGTNSISVSVSNNCGTASDSDSYTYTSCVPPTMVKTNEECANGKLYVYLSVSNITHSQITTSPTSQRFGSGNSLSFAFPLGAGTSMSWSITGTGDCGSPVTVSGTKNKCDSINVGIIDGGCSTTGCADYLFLVDNSGSIDANEFADMQATIKSTIESIDSTSINARYAVVQYAAPYPFYSANSAITISHNFTSSASTAKIFSRAYANGNDFLDPTLGLLLSSGITPRSGCVKHLVIFTDANGLDSSSEIKPFGNRNTFINNGWIISTIKYKNNTDQPTAISELAAVSSVGGNYNLVVYVNSGDPEGSGVKPRRLYVRNSFDGQPVPGLVADVTTQSCTLTAFYSGCTTGSPTYSWTASGGGSITAGAGTKTITTNGIGSYIVSITVDGCTKTRTFTY